MKNGAVTSDRAFPGDISEMLSPAAQSSWAKYDRGSGMNLSLHRHLADSAAVADYLWSKWIPRHVQELIAEALPGGVEDARHLVRWLAGTHDIGKATPAFACQVDPLADSMRLVGLDMPGAKQFGDSRRIAPHGLAGQLLLRDWLAERYDWSGRVAGPFAVIAGGHHGVPPGFVQIHDLDMHPELLRTPGSSEQLWKQVQWELLDACAEVFGVKDRLSEWRGVKLPQQAQVLLTAMVIVADWIASDTALFPYFPPDNSGGDGTRSHASRVSAAWEGLRLPPAWTPADLQETAAELFESRFSLPPDSLIRPVQQDAVRLARELPEPGLLVVEAPMGEGKTEAALAVAEIFAARSGAGGCFVALPTRATSNAMFDRVLDWLRHLPSDTDLSVNLAHAKAALSDEFADLMRAAAPVSAIDLDGPESSVSARHDRRNAAAELVAHRWLRGRKKGMLSSFVVGTIDQLLFAGLKSRHLALRHLALVGKVVVIDEVHAYDAYMSVYLERVLSWLGQYRIPVVMLSATLPDDRRRALIEAYSGSVSAEPDGDRDASAAYPLLTAVAPGSAVMTAQPAAAADRGVQVHVEGLDDDAGALGDRLALELQDGGCVLVVRNTVGRVLQTAERLRERFGAANVTTAHSRFVDADRADKDAELVARFGPAGVRPAMHIVVASQVVEQSLDIDFDLLVTDLAPIDLLLQRMGRLHRHLRGGAGQQDRPDRLRTARCLITGVNWQSTPPEPVGGSVAVYKRFPLLRSLAVLAPHLAGKPVGLPGDIKSLVQDGYGDSYDVPPTWNEAMDNAEREHAKHLGDQRERAQVFCIDEVRPAGRPLIGWVDGGVGDADDTRAGRAQVRDGAETIEVVVVQRRADGTLWTLPWLRRGLGGLELPTDAVPPPHAAKGAAASALRLPYHFSQPWMFDRTVEELEQTYVPAWQENQSSWLAGELILVLDEDCRAQLAGYELTYDKDNGLEVSLIGERDVKLVHSSESFDLVSRPWLPVLRLDGAIEQLSLREIFEQSGSIRRLQGDLPTQEFALLRLLLAILHDALDGPSGIDQWDELWMSEDPFEAVPAYLDRFRDSFDLLHPVTPFYQVAGLHTEKNEAGALDKIVADVPNGEPFFTMRMPGVGRLSFAEAARWVVHTHAFDTSGIKSGVIGDPKAAGGKRYPQGVAWLGNLGGIYAEGNTLRETLLLNLIANDSPKGTDDRPAWRRDSDGDPFSRTSGPSGLRDLYTWQSRRMLLEHDSEGVTGAVLTYGDALTPHNRHTIEPMTGWRRSLPQEKKLGTTPVYMPREHDPTRAAWRGLDSIIAAQQRTGTTQTGESARYLRSGLVSWLAQLTVEGPLDPRSLFRVRTVGAEYGTQQSIIDEVIDDGITMPVILLHSGDPRFGQCAVDAVIDAESAVTALGDLAANLAAAAGTATDSARSIARDRGFGAMDGPYRHWLRDLGTQPDTNAARLAWQNTAHRIVSDQARILLDSAGPAAAQGRTVTTSRGAQWMDDALADLWFRGRLNKALSLRSAPAAPSTPDDKKDQP